MSIRKKALKDCKTTFTSCCYRFRNWHKKLFFSNIVYIGKKWGWNGYRENGQEILQIDREALERKWHEMFILPLHNTCLNNFFFRSCSFYAGRNTWSSSSSYIMMKNKRNSFRKLGMKWPPGPAMTLILFVTLRYRVIHTKHIFFHYISFDPVGGIMFMIRWQNERHILCLYRNIRALASCWNLQAIDDFQLFSSIASFFFLFCFREWFD